MGLTDANKYDKSIDDVFKKNTEPKEEPTPRYVLSLTDTKITVPGPEGEQYFSVTIGSDNYADFNRHISKAKRQNAGHTEFEAALYFFADASGKLDAERPQEQKK